KENFSETSGWLHIMLTLVRIERDFTRGELCQFQTAFPLEIDGRIEPRRFQKTIDKLNELLEKAHHPKYNILDNFLTCLTIYTSTFCIKSNYDKRIDEILKYLDDENHTLYNRKGLNFRNPLKSSFLFVSF
ncbi:953_t:CDS:2, partial [Entrophospora sp. SA101]